MTQPIDTATVEIVPDFDRFVPLLRRELDRAFTLMRREFAEAFSAAERGAADAGQQIGTSIARGGERAESALREVEREARSSFGTVRREAATAGASMDGLRGIVGKLGLAAAGAGLAAGLGAITLAGLKAAASLEQTQIAFNSLLGSAEKGKEVFDGLKEFAAATPFELTDLAPIAQRFLAFNETVGLTDAYLQKFLTTLGDVASVTSAGAFGMERVTLALGQIASTGKLTLDNLNQIADALPGFSPIAAVAAAKGITTAEAMEQISAGTISATEGVSALIAGMEKFPGAAGAMEAQSQTLLGVFSTFKDTLSQALAGAFAPIIPSLKETIGEVTPIIGDAVTILAPLLGDVLTETLGALAPAIEPLALILSHTIAALLPFVNIIGKILPPIIEALVPVFVALEPVLTELAEPITELLMAFMPLVPVLADVLIAVVTVAAPLLKLFGIILSFVSIQAIAPIVRALAAVLGFLAEAVRQFGVWLTQIDWEAVLMSIASFFEGLGLWFLRVIRWLVELPVKAAVAWTQFVLAAVNKLLELVVWFRGLPKRILSAIGNLGKSLLQSGKDLVRGLWDGIVAAGGWLWDKISGFVKNNVLGAMKDALGIASPSKEAAKQVGRWIPPGVADGVMEGLPALRGMIDGLLGGGTDGGVAVASAGSGSGMTFGPGSIVINFVGVVPTAAEAQAVGENVVAGMDRAQTRQTTATAARMI